MRARSYWQLKLHRWPSVGVTSNRNFSASLRVVSGVGARGGEGGMLPPLSDGRFARRRAHTHGRNRFSSNTNTEPFSRNTPSHLFHHWPPDAWRSRRRYFLDHFLDFLLVSSHALRSLFQLKMLIDDRLIILFQASFHSFFFFFFFHSIACSRYDFLICRSVLGFLA